MADELFISVVETARRLGIGRTAVYELIGEGRLHVVKLGARTLVAVSELERFAAELSESGDEPEEEP
jgi:excisionase family DNA binding protein